MIRYFWIVIFVVGILCLAAMDSNAGIVRTLKMNDSKMEVINFSLGKSTVLRFVETPKKIVVGNKNYFNLEFIGRDVTIQPLGNVNSNLFIYGDYYVYGFILRPSLKAKYDDLVNVRWKSRYKKKVKANKPKRKRVKPLSTFILKIGKSLTVSALSPKASPLKGGWLIMDLSVTNTSKNMIRANGISIDLTRRKKSLPNQRHFFASDEIKPGQQIKARVFVKLEKKLGFTLNMKVSDQKGKVIIPRRVL